MLKALGAALAVTLITNPAGAAVYFDSETISSLIRTLYWYSGSAEMAASPTLNYGDNYSVTFALQETLYVGHYISKIYFCNIAEFAKHKTANSVLFDVNGNAIFRFGSFVYPDIDASQINIDLSVIAGDIKQDSRSLYEIQVSFTSLSETPVSIAGGPVSIQVYAVPEPPAWALALIGLASLGLASRVKRGSAPRPGYG